MTDETGELPTVRVRPGSCQPSKAGLEEPARIDAMPEDVTRADFHQVGIIKDPDAWDRARRQTSALA